MKHALVVLALWWCGARGEAVQRALAAGGAFAVQSTVLLGAAERGAPDVGCRLAAALDVAPRGDLELLFTLDDPHLQVRGAAAGAEWERRPSVWDAGAGGAWSARFAAGALVELRLPPDDPPHARDFKRALTSLFYYAPGAEPAAERNETDASGACAVTYEPARRVKRRCAGDAAAGASARRLATYTVRGGELLALHAEEVLELAAGSLQVRSWHALERTGPAPPAPPSAAPAPFVAPLELEPAAPEPDDDAREELESAIARHRAALAGEAAGAGGGVAAARGLLRLLPALRAAPRAALLRALRDERHRDVLPGLCRALGLAGTPAAVRAARDFLQPAGDDPLEALALAFLAGFALAPDAPDEAALDVLRLGAEARRPAVAAAALLGAADAAGPGARPAVREALLRALARCRDDECRAARLLALGSARSDAEPLLEQAERGTARAAVAALTALRGAPVVSSAQVARLDRLATDGARPLEVRAVALAAAVERRAAPRGLPAVARALRLEDSPTSHELRRALGDQLGVPPRSWDARAPGGTSGALARWPGWAAGGWRARLDSLQLAARGVLRRGVVALRAVAPDNSSHPVLEVSVWTRGLEALAGVAGGEGEEEGAAGGLALAVAGKHLQDITLFDGQAELLGHVWAGRGAEPAAVLRAVRPLEDASATLPLLAGVRLLVRTRAALALALDAHAAASLWHRTARGALSLRAALAADASLALRAAWGELRAERELSAEPRLRIALDLDFYDGVALCVRAAAPAHALLEEVRLRSVLGARRTRVSRRREARTARPGRTLALGRANDAACRELRAADDADDADD